jgi:hypothetical protein
MMFKREVATVDGGVLIAGYLVGELILREVPRDALLAAAVAGHAAWEFTLDDHAFEVEARMSGQAVRARGIEWSDEAWERGKREAWLRLGESVNWAWPGGAS